MHSKLFPILMNRSFPIRILPILILLFLSLSCTVEEVEFQSLKDIRVHSLKEGVITINALATFYNPNKSGLRITKTEIDVLVNGKIAGTVKPLEKVKIKKLSVFEVPVELSVDLKKAATDGNIFNLLLKRKVDLSMKGYIKVSKFLIPSKVPVDFEHTLSF